VGRVTGRSAQRRGVARRSALAVVGLAVSVGLLALGAWALRPGGVAGQGVRPPEARPHPGKGVYDRDCAVCHGPGGQADGPAAAGLPIKPPPLTDGRLLNGLTDDFLYQVVRDGAGSVGLAPQMPGFGRQLTEKEITDVVAYVRTLAQPPYRPRSGAPVTYQAPPPVQPIEFSHAVHAGSYGIDCQYCHADARRGVYAGLPSVQRCMGCHKLVAAQGNPEVQKLTEAWTAKQPIPWVRIHKVPGFVEFPHKRHIEVGLACQTCHGPVETMQRVAQVAPLTMGWCISCHAERKGPLECVTCHH
jgi:mono/diheme cytochrome c family protein